MINYDRNCMRLEVRSRIYIRQSYAECCNIERVCIRYFDIKATADVVQRQGSEDQSMRGACPADWLK